VDAAVTVSEFGDSARYDHHAHRWLTRDYLETLAAARFKQHGADDSSKTLADPSVMESFGHSSHRPDWEFLEVPRAVSMGLCLKNDLNRIDTILDACWARH
jgi:hypothetical protein